MSSSTWTIYDECSEFPPEGLKFPNECSRCGRPAYGKKLCKDCRQRTIESILQQLVALKDHKDKHGQDEYYLAHQSKTWDAARKVLKL